jgi:molecular chaperone HtpG
MSAKENFTFQAETRELLDLVIHSLYTHKEIFLRELISNASDALDRLRFEALQQSEPAADTSGLRIRLEVDPEKRILEIDDNGIGMSRQEIVDNLGTIASSGTRGFLEALKAKQDAAAALPELIGQFGVGFYSAFMIADRVEVETKRAGEEKGVRWTSDGKGEYALEDIDKAECGTTVVLHLKDASGEEGALDFTQDHVLRGVVKRYSDFIEYPIELETGEGEDAKVETLNSMKPLWTRPRSDVEDSEYVEFYKHLTHDWHDPLETIHFRVEGTAEYSALLYLPEQRPLDLFDPNQAKSRVHLYVKRVFIMEDCEGLMPVWLRFVRGVVDSSDLPLNVSRETLQHNRQLGQIKKRLTRKVLDTLAGILKDRRADYGGFWNAFGPVLKEGLYYDDENREELAKLALFASTAGDETTTLPEYLERMPVKQEEIYVLLAPDLASARRSPHLERFAEKGFEVLFLTDPVDEFVLQRFTEFGERKLRRIDRGELDLEEEEEKEEREAKEKELAPLLEAVRKELAEGVEEVRFSNRLTDSPACLVASEGELTPQMRRMLREQGQDVPEPKRVLELNACHPVVSRLEELSGDDADHARFAETCELLLGTALVTEGASPPDPTRYAKLVTDLLIAD